MTVQQYATAFGLAALLGVAAACSDTTETVDTVQQSDPMITMSVQASYFGDEVVKGHEIDVDTSNGVVTLSGSVDSEQARSRAGELAGEVEGVTEVQNGLMVSMPVPDMADDDEPMAMAGESDVVERAEAEPGLGDQINAGWITTKIQAQYFASPDVKGHDINVTTSPSGRVTLDGHVASEPLRQEALRIARSTEGVAAVEDQLTVGAETDASASDTAMGFDEQLSDAWITTKIESKYFLDGTVKGRNIDVTTELGLVTLTGEVGSAFERRQAVALARATDGVDQVLDDLEVAESLSGDGDMAADGSDAEAAPDDEVLVAQIQSSYFLDETLKTETIDVSADDGVVTLEGEVSSTEARDAAETTAAETPGVRTVENEIELAMSATPADGSGA